MQTHRLDMIEDLQKMLDKVSYLGMGVHVLFTALFFTWGYENLAYLNIACTVAWVHGYNLNKQNKVVEAIFFLSVEIIVHTVATVVTLGWESGFQLFLLGGLVFHLLFAAENVKRMFTATVIFSSVFVFLKVFSAQTVGLYTPAALLEVLYYINFFSVLTGGGLCVFYFNKASSRVKRELHRLASIDPLTGLFTRRAFDDDLEKSLQQSRLFSVIMTDIDYFKQINDTYGHAVGDAVLKELAQRFREKLRQSDIVFRWGGEEFLVILRDTDEQNAHIVAKSLCETIAEKPFIVHQHELQVSITCGVSVVHEEMNPMGEIIHRADKALYLGKEQGRNRVVMFCERVFTNMYQLQGEIR